jgi:uncharacterized protein with HEPN domain
MREDRLRLVDILEAIENVERYSSKGRRTFKDDELIRIWILHHIQIIGEASANLSADFRDRYSQIEWARIEAMRNILIHQYFGIDWQEVWDTAAKDLPQLKTKIQSVLHELGESPGPKKP